jgi:protein-disulfide isomerase
MKMKSKRFFIPFLAVAIAAVAIFAFGCGSTPSNNSVNNTTAGNRAAVPTPQMGRDVTANAPAGAPLTTNVLGSPDAKVTVEEFADYQCPACGSTYPTMKEIQSVYGDRIKFVFRNFPLAIPAHDKAYRAALAAEAAAMQGKFWAMQDLLFTNQRTWSPAADFDVVLKEYATKLGLDIAKFEADMNGMEAKSRIDADKARGQALGFTSTPTIYINGKMIPFQELTVPKLREVIDAELKAAAAKTPEPEAPKTNSNAAEGARPKGSKPAAANTADEKK